MRDVPSRLLRPKELRWRLGVAAGKSNYGFVVPPRRSGKARISLNKEKFQSLINSFFCDSAKKETFDVVASIDSVDAAKNFDATICHSTFSQSRRSVPQGCHRHRRQATSY